MYIRIIVPVLIALVSSTGCDESVNPVLGIDKSFTAYGFFNPLADTQAVRIFPIENQLVRTGTEPIDAQLIAEALETGRTFTWQDSLVRFQDGSYGHVFWSAFRPEFEQTYRLQITNANDGFAQVQAQVPAFIEPEEQAPEAGILNRVVLPIIWRGAPQLPAVRVTYFFNVGEFSLSYVLEKEQVEGGWRVPIQLSRDAGAAFFVLRDHIGSDGRLVLQDIEIRSVIGNDAWTSPIGIFDAELLVEPGTFSNVEDGFGFVGAGYVSALRWLPDRDVLTQAGFLLPEEEEE